jgi:hypothetical protein
LQIEAEIAREAAAAEVNKPAAAASTNAPAGAAPAESKTNAPVVNADSKSLSTATEAPADTVKRASNVEVAAVTAIGCIIALVIVGIAVATYRARKIHKAEQAKAIVEHLLGSEKSFRDAVPQADRTEVLH